MRLKLNEGTSLSYHHSIASQASDLYRRFKRQFTILLNPDPTNRNFLDKVYVNLPAFQRELSEHISYQEDSYKSLIGLKGIGKSTLVRHTLGAHGEINLIEGSLVIFINAESTERIDTAVDHASVIFGAVVRRVEKEFGVGCGKRDLYDFIEINKPTLLSEATLTPDDDAEMIIDNLFRENRRAYYLEKLKYLLSKNETGIGNLVLVLDNLEAISDWSKKLTYVKEVLIDYECLKNRGGGFQYYVKLLIVCRPDSYFRFIRDEVFNTYPNRNELLLDQAPPLDEIFKGRFDALLQRDGIQVSNRAEWNRAYEVLMDLSKFLSVKYKANILNLCNQDVRTSVNLLERIFANRIYFQGGFPLRSAFTIDRRFFTTKRSNVMKALVYGNSTVYVENPMNPTPNVLRNYEDSESDMLPLLLFAFFKTQRSKDGDFNYFKYVDFDELFSKVNEVLPYSEVEMALERLLSHFRSHGLLLVSPWAKAEERKFCLSPKAEALWEMISESSILLMAYRDDLWISPKVEKYGDSLDEAQIFQEYTDLVNYYIDRESELIDYIIQAGVRRRYIQLFGNVSVSRPLFLGYREAVHANYKKRIWSSLKELNDVTSKIEGVSKKLEM